MDRLAAYARTIVEVEHIFALGPFASLFASLNVTDVLRLTVTVAACQIANDLVLRIRSPKQDMVVFLWLAHYASSFCKAMTCTAALPGWCASPRSRERPPYEHADFPSTLSNSAMASKAPSS